MKRYERSEAKLGVLKWGRGGVLVGRGMTPEKLTLLRKKINYTSEKVKENMTL